MAISIVNLPKHFSSKFDYAKWAKGRPADNASKLELDRFWTKERQYWSEGRGGICGEQYFYLTVGTIKLMSGQEIVPRWRDFDEFIITEDTAAAAKGQDTIIVKRREFGLSSYFGGCATVYTCLMNPGSISLLTSADKPRVESLFSEKALVMYFGLPRHIRPGRLSDRKTGFLHMGSKGSDGRQGGTNSKIICRETADSDKNAMAFENYRAKYIFLDELFRHERASQVVMSSQACLRQGFVKDGHMVLGGSCGNMTKEGAKEGENMWNDAIALNIKTIFIPGTACIEQAPELDDQGLPTGKILNFCVNGHSDHKAAEEWILKTRERLGKAKNKKHADSFLVEYPLTASEVFAINSRGLLPESVYEKMKESDRKIKLGEFKEGRYSIKPSQTVYRAEPDKAGKFIIVVPPTPMGEYIAGCDPIPFGTATIDKGSDFAVSVKDRMAEMYCAYYAERILDADEACGNAVLLQELYKSNKFQTGALMNPEMNMGAVLLEKYRQFGKLYLLCDRLIHLGIAYESGHEAKGWYNNNKTGERANNYLIEYLKKHADIIGMERILEELRRWPDGNNDIVDSMKSCELLDRDMIEKYKKVYVPVAKQKKRIITRDQYGRTKEEWI